MNANPDHFERVAAYARECIENECELVSPREAAKLFGVAESTIRKAAHDRKIHATFTLTAARDLPLYRFRNLVDYFGDRSPADPTMLEKMRKSGMTCFIEGAGGWLLLTEHPTLRWEDAVADD